MNIKKKKKYCGCDCIYSLHLSPYLLPFLSYNKILYTLYFIYLIHRTAHRNNRFENHTILIITAPHHTVCCRCLQSGDTNVHLFESVRL